MISCDIVSILFPALSTDNTCKYQLPADVPFILKLVLLAKFPPVYLLTSFIPSGVLLLLKIYLLFVKSIPLSSSFNVTVAVIVCPACAVVGLKLIVAVFGSVLSLIDTLPSSPEFTSSYHFTYNLCSNNYS